VITGCEDGNLRAVILDSHRQVRQRSTIYSPEGCTREVENEIGKLEAIGLAGICLGILSNDSIVFVAVMRSSNKLLNEVFHSEKIYK